MNLDTRLLHRRVKKLREDLHKAEGELHEIQLRCDHKWRALHYEHILMGQIHDGDVCETCGLRNY